jgi:DNA-binding transcriptional ArsR family regulator
MRRDVFQAIADPTRRQIITMVAREALNLNAVARQFDVSRPAISKHIKILVECGLITVNQKGRERFCEAKVEKLTEVSDWLVQFREMWEAKFDSLDNYLTELQQEGKEITKAPTTEARPEVVTETEPVDNEEPAAPEMPKFLAPRKKKAVKPEAKTAEAAEAVDEVPKPKAKARKKTKPKKAKTVVAKAVKPEKKKEAKEPEQTPPEVAPNQYSLF